ncbi:DUF3465 domain-containing protein [Teredinibacter waterburyi]|uniref:DUF3465 domain-containing protein n=1 Tax=Teredinibacter waterburyi TaxID=1500538 RepID=UPI00165EFA3C|nr:DUF3465 domain-containing protein [Teredinibacter waterburyi]
MRKSVALGLIVCAVAYSYWNYRTLPSESIPTSGGEVGHAEEISSQFDNLYSSVEEAYEKRLSDVQVIGVGRVVKLLPDDNKGSRHQKFILKLSSGITVLVAHNIDLAKRLNLLKVNDTLEFFGEYEWNDRGGVVHWTHHDPSARHIDGWLKHDGVVYK